MKIIRLALLFVCIVLLSGCWDKKELNEVAVVIGVGIDKVSEKEGVYEITAQVIKPQEGDQQGAELPTWSVTAQGETIMDAIKNLNRLSPRRLYWSHLQIIIFSEGLAREGVAPIITWFERDRDSRAGSYVVVTRGSAQDLLNQKIELGSIPAKAMSDLLDSAEQRQIIARKVKLRDFTTVLTTPGIDPSLDVIQPKNRWKRK
ncbi:Ger(x)C family spore germination protein [Gracilibacillus thailandensis]|uniref:Ger(x)C family spore germination protein n=1 Tax=Gracilibacillus thailandensis TaxID=563735 RepID=UPI001F09FFC3|nr:Ger(x)C family spore germination protein [Gracilibacillus thailandensis]